MIAPVGLFFFAHGRSVQSRVFGAAILISCLVAIACSGSRGGYITYIAATVSFTALWLIRTVRWNKGSLAPALVGVSASIGFVILLGLILFWPRLHNVVLGGGQEAYSNQSRIDQMHTAWPKIVSNPITGHGVGNTGDIIGYYTPGSQFPTVDSYVLAMAAETGIPSVLFFFWHDRDFGLARRAQLHSKPDPARSACRVPRVFNARLWNLQVFPCGARKPNVVF